MATLNQLRTRVDAFLAAKWPTIVARQDNFFANRGRYWQGLRTHTIIPAHTNTITGDAVADRLADNPADAFENWLAAFPEWEGIGLPCAVQVDSYESDAGKGWVATLYVTYSGVTYRRSRNVGPLSALTKAWEVVPSGPPGS